MASAAQQQDARAPACLLLLCGLPAAGKTTLARAMAQHAQREGATCGVRVAHVCFDDYQQAGGSFEPAAWKAGRQQAWAQVAELLSAVADGTAVPRVTPARSPDTPCSASPQTAGDSHQPLLVIADDNMHLRSMRQQGRRIAAEHSAAALTLYLPIQPEDAHARNHRRPPGARLPQEVMARMCQVFEPPDGSEALDEQCGTASSPTLHHAAEVLEKVQRAWGPPHRMPATAALDEARAAGRAATAASASHQLDIASRGVLAAALAAVPGPGADGKAALSRELNARRRCMLQDFRHGADDSAAAAEAAEQQLAAFEAATDDAVLATQMTSLHEL